MLLGGRPLRRSGYPFVVNWKLPLKNHQAGLFHSMLLVSTLDPSGPYTPRAPFQSGPGPACLLSLTSALAGWPAALLSLAKSAGPQGRPAGSLFRTQATGKLKPGCVLNPDTLSICLDCRIPRPADRVGLSCQLCWRPQAQLSVLH